MILIMVLYCIKRVQIFHWLQRDFQHLGYFGINYASITAQTQHANAPDSKLLETHEVKSVAVVRSQTQYRLPQ